MREFDIRQATPADSDDVCRMVFQLLSELYPDSYSIDKLKPVTDRILRESKDVFPFIAMVDRRPVGVMVLNRCTAIYAFGDFGEISELFIDPAFRSSGLGQAFIDTAVAFAQSKGWTMLEVGAPSTPQWQRTVDFYLRNGFAEIGPRLYRSFVGV